jgi:hypothetical protein
MIKSAGTVLLAVSLAVGCTSQGSESRAASPNMSIAWDAGEAVRHVFTEGCLRAVEANRPIKETIDRGVALSRVRPLDVSPMDGDPPGTPAYAVISGASVVMTGTGERCSVAASGGDGLKMRAMLLEVLDVQQTGWRVLDELPFARPEWDKNWKHDLRCRPISDGVMVAQIVTAPGMPRPLQAFVFRSRESNCPAAGASR